VLIKEFIHSPTNTPESNLVTTLQLLQHRYKDRSKNPKISTNSLINMILNTDRTFDYDALVSANETNPAVKTLIKSYNKDYVILHSKDEEMDATTTNPPKGDATQAPIDTVDSMAKRAAKKRDADLF
jgi:hypothetical protein